MRVGAAVLLLVLSAGSRVHAQLWIDAVASSSRPPIEPFNTTSLYSLLGLRAQTTAGGLQVDGSAYGGTGARKADGRWFSAYTGAGRSGLYRGSAWNVSLNGYGLRYVDPFEYTAGALTLHGGVARRSGNQTVTLSADLTRGAWRSITEVEAFDGVPAFEIDSIGNLRLDVVEATVARPLGFGTGTLVMRALIGSIFDAYTAASLATTRYGLDIRLNAAALLGSESRAGGGVMIGRQFKDRLYVTAQVEQQLPDLIFTTLSTFAVSVTGSWQLSTTDAAAHAVTRPIITVRSRSRTGTRVTFALADNKAKSVALVGSFSDWQPTPMRRAENGWSIDLELKAGSHQFAFLVDGEWVVPKGAPGIIDDGFGRQNATVVIERL